MVVPVSSPSLIQFTLALLNAMMQWWYGPHNAVGFFFPLNCWIFRYDVLFCAKQAGVRSIFYRLSVVHFWLLFHVFWPVLTTFITLPCDLDSVSRYGNVDYFFVPFLGGYDQSGIMTFIRRLA